MQNNLERGIAIVRTFRSAVLEQGDQDVGVVDLAQLVEAVLVEMGPALKASRIEVKLDVAGERPQVGGARVRLSQVVEHLVSNALTHAYGHEGGVIEVSVKKALLRDGMAELVVADHGRGMSEEEAARCTDAFYTTTRNKPAAGLGLFVARHVVEAELGGSLLLETKAGAGVRWTVLLPAVMPK
jgi:two-component system phosphate regulon sensor histidine kinase PhoR